MNNKELDKLLKQSMRKEFPLPAELDRRTVLQMKRINERKVYRFTGILITLSCILTGIGVRLFWQLDSGIVYKGVVTIGCFSLFILFVLLYIINYQTYVRKEIGI